MRPSLRRRDDSRSCRLAARYRNLLSPRLRLRVELRQFGNPWSLLSSCYRPLSSPPSNKRLCVPFHGTRRDGIPSRKEPVGLFPNDDRRPNGITIIPEAKRQMHDMGRHCRCIICSHLLALYCCQGRCSCCIDWHHSSVTNITT